jgi:hypothetical protein
MMIVGYLRPDRLTGTGQCFVINQDAQRGLISVEHDGSITWDELQTIKNDIFGSDACAIEIYPPASSVVNNVPMRHLWLLGPRDWWPDLGHEGEIPLDTLRSRFEAAFKDDDTLERPL